MAETFWGLIGIIAKELQNRGGEELGESLGSANEKKQSSTPAQYFTLFLPKVWIWNSVKTLPSYCQTISGDLNLWSPPMPSIYRQATTKVGPQKKGRQRLDNFQLKLQVFFLSGIVLTFNKIPQYHTKKTKTKIHPWRLTWNMSSWRFGSDHFPF